MNQAAEQLNCHFHQQMVTRETQRMFELGGVFRQCGGSLTESQIGGWGSPQVLLDFSFLVFIPVII